MTKPHIFLAAVLIVAAPVAAIAGSSEYQNLDAVGLAAGKGMKTKCETTGDYEGKTYCLQDEHAKPEFMKDAPGNRAKADAFYQSKASDPNWTPCDYTASPNDPNSCN